MEEINGGSVTPKFVGYNREIVEEFNKKDIQLTQRFIDKNYGGLDCIFHSSLINGEEYVKQMHEFAEEFNKDITWYLEQHKIPKEKTPEERAKEELEIAEENAIDFYMKALLNNLNVHMVISHPTIPTEEMSVALMFKIIDRVNERNKLRAFCNISIIKYERLYNKLKFIY